MHKHLLPLFCLFAFTGNADIPNLGDSASLLWTQGEEIDIGLQAYNQLYNQGQVDTQLENQDYLDYLGYKVAANTHARTGFHFFLTNASSINAFASIGGYIGVNAGLVLATDNEHELAGVLAHEISHVSQRHIARTIIGVKNRQMVNAAGIAASILVATQSENNAGSGLLSAVIANETQQQLNDIQQHEIEADRIGTELMEAAGFNKVGMQSFFAKLQTPSNANEIPSYLLTHPLPQDRQVDIGLINSQSATLKSSDEYYLFKARLTVQMLGKDKIEKIINKGLSSSNSQIRNATYYSQALFAMKYGKADEALSKLTQLNSDFSSKRDIQLLKAKLLQIDSQSSQADEIYQTLSKSFSGDNIVAFEYAQFLYNQNQFSDASKILDKQIARGTAPAKLYFLYGRILDKLNQNDKKTLILVDYYLMIGDYSSAKTQIEIAVTQSGISPQTKSQLEAKLKDIEKIIGNKDR